MFVVFSKTPWRVDTHFSCVSIALEESEFWTENSPVATDTTPIQQELKIEILQNNTKWFWTGLVFKPHIGVAFLEFSLSVMYSQENRDSAAQSVKYRSILYFLSITGTTTVQKFTVFVYF